MRRMTDVAKARAPLAGKHLPYRNETCSTRRRRCWRLSGKEKESPRNGFLYWSDDGDLMALRVDQYKIVFAEQRSKGLDVWREPLSQLRIPKMFDLRSDPFERGEESFKYNDWFVEHVPFQYAAQAIVHSGLRASRNSRPRPRRQLHR